MGSGVKANILSSLTSKIISTMMAANMKLEDCVSTIAATLPGVRGAEGGLLHLYHHPHHRQRRGGDHPVRQPLADPHPGREVRGDPQGGQRDRGEDDLPLPDQAPGERLSLRHERRHHPRRSGAVLELRLGTERHHLLPGDDVRPLLHRQDLRHPAGRGVQPPLRRPPPGTTPPSAW